MALMIIGIMLKVTKVNIPKKGVIHMVFWLNTILSIPKVFEYTNRYGVDYIAYIQQAGAYYNGETDYTKISSHLGPCYYPAGHIWHYLPAYWLHLQTEYAEIIIKAGHHVIHSMTIMFTVKIAYLYFDKDETKSNGMAQFIAFVLLSNRGDREFHSCMYND